MRIGIPAGEASELLVEPFGAEKAGCGVEGERCAGRAGVAQGRSSAWVGQEREPLTCIWVIAASRARTTDSGSVLKLYTDGLRRGVAIAVASVSASSSQSNASCRCDSVRRTASAICSMRA